MSDNGKQALAVHGIDDRGGGWYALPDGELVRGRNKAVRTVRARETKKVVRNATEKLLRDRFAQLAGLTYGRDRDVYEVAGYPTHYEFAEGWSRYKRQGLAKRVVDLPVQKTWRHPPTIKLEDDSPEDLRKFADEWEELWKRLKLQSNFERADRMASIGQFSVVFLGLAGAATDQQLKEPAEGINGIQDVLYARPFKESDVAIQKWVTDADDERFGKPLTYKIQLGGGDDQAGSFPSKSVVVHWTRVLHIVEDPLDSDVFGLPRLEPVVNTLVDWEKVQAGSSEAVWQLAVRILQIGIDPEAALTEDEWDNLDDELEELVHDLRRHFMGQGVDMELLGGELPDPTGVVDMLMTLAAVDSRIPKRVLFGTETGERASEQDERAFLGMVGERIEQHAEPNMVRQLTDRLIGLGALDDPGEYELEWPPLREDTEEEKAEADKARAEVAKNLTQMGGNPLELVEITEEGRVRLKPTVDTEQAQNLGRMLRSALVENGHSREEAVGIIALALPRVSQAIAAEEWRDGRDAA